MLFMQQVVSGIPQGSILGPLLFSMHVIDFPTCLQASNVLTYEDDNVIYYAESDANHLLQVFWRGQDPFGLVLQERSISSS